MICPGVSWVLLDGGYVVQDMYRLLLERRCEQSGHLSPRVFFVTCEEVSYAILRKSWNLKILVPVRGRAPFGQYQESWPLAGLDFLSMHSVPVVICCSYFQHCNNIYICYLPAGRSVLGKTVPEVLSTAQGRRAQFFPIRTDLSRQITCLFFRVVYKVFKSRDSVFTDFRTKQWKIYISWRFLV